MNVLHHHFLFHLSESNADTCPSEIVPALFSPLVGTSHCRFKRNEEWYVNLVGFVAEDGLSLGQHLHHTFYMHNFPQLEIEFCNLTVALWPPT